ncbi:hypothetical protein AVEN_244584-1, partial [Araneus ventricosus]
GVVRSRLRVQRVPGLKPDSTEDPSCIAPVANLIIPMDQMSFRWCGAEVWRRSASSGVVFVI